MELPFFAVWYPSILQISYILERKPEIARSDEAVVSTLGAGELSYDNWGRTDKLPDKNQRMWVKTWEFIKHLHPYFSSSLFSFARCKPPPWVWRTIDTVSRGATTNTTQETHLSTPIGGHRLLPLPIGSSAKHEAAWRDAPRSSSDERRLVASEHTGAAEPPNARPESWNPCVSTRDKHQPVTVQSARNTDGESSVVTSVTSADSRQSATDLPPSITTWYCRWALLHYLFEFRKLMRSKYGPHRPKFKIFWKNMII